MDQRPMEALCHHPAFRRPGGRPQTGTGMAFPESRLHSVQVLDLAEEPAAELGRLVTGLMELPAHVGPAAGQHHRMGMVPGEHGIGAVAIALQGAREVRRQQVAHAGRSPAGLPLEDDITARP